MMVRLTLLLFLISFISSSTAVKVNQAVEVLMDPSNCVNLRCEWRGVGEHCKPITLFYQQKTVPGAIPLSYPLGDDESESNIFAFIKKRYPLNTFTVVNENFVMGEKCKGKRLYCNYLMTLSAPNYDSLLKFIEIIAYPLKFQC